MPGKGEQKKITKRVPTTKRKMIAWFSNRTAPENFK
jgi:hypothetical protein